MFPGLCRYVYGLEARLLSGYMGVVPLLWGTDGASLLAAGLVRQFTKVRRRTTLNSCLRLNPAHYWRWGYIICAQPVLFLATRYRASTPKIFDQNDPALEVFKFCERQFNLWIL